MKKMLCMLCLLLALMCVFAACNSEETPSTGNNGNTVQNGGSTSGGDQGGDNQGSGDQGTNQGGTPGDATTHTHTYGEWGVSKAATCTAKGEEKRTCSCGESETREIEMLAHTFGDWSVSKAGTCAAKGEEKRTCACGESEARETEKNMENHVAWGAWSETTPATCQAKGGEKRTCACGKSEARETEKNMGNHVAWGTWRITTPATCVSKGEKKRICGCGAEEKADIAKTGVHIYNGGVCVCGAVEIPYTRDGNIVTFGKYPQSNVTDAALISSLNASAGALPTSTNAQNWMSYGYYISGEVQNYMWYIDVSRGGEQYRGVYFISYRPYTPSDASGSDNSYQDDNGYLTGTVYWFRYEPLTWRILKEEGGTALLLCESIIDAQAYQNEYVYDSDTNQYYTTANGAPDGTYANNYAYSTIRAWLNETFYETAFTEMQQQIILMTTVDNGADSMAGTGDAYICEDTQDKVFLLSIAELTTQEYGFVADFDDLDVAKRKKATDYAQAQGAAVATNMYLGFRDTGYWWLCSSGYKSHCVFDIYPEGCTSDNERVDFVFEGVVPALWIRF